jgi:hypothetical protein
MSLLKRCCPSTIRRCVVAVWVDAVDGHAWRTLSHVSKEIFKRVPSFADYNSTGTVVFKVFAVFVITALEHAVPCSVRRSQFSIVPMSVFKVTFSHEATTGACNAAS